MKKIFESDLDSLSLEEEDLLFEKLAKELGLELFKLGAIKKEVAFLLSLDQMRYFEAIIIKKEEKTLLIALKNPFEKSYQETLKMIFSNFSIVFGLIKNRDFKAAISWLEREELLQKLEVSRKHADEGKFRDADDVISDMREKYGI